MSVPGIIPRYAAEFYPFLTFAFVIFLRTVSATLFRLRYLLIGLVAVSVIINSLTTVAWIVDKDLNTTQKTRDAWKAFLGRESR